MTDHDDMFALRRLLVAADASQPSLAALDLACDLAERHGAEVVVLFVEDVRTQRLTNFPDLVEIRRIGGSRGALTAADLRRQYRARARRLHHALEIIQRRIEISCRLQVVQGSVPAEIIGATRDVDLVVLGRTGTAGSRKGLGSTAQRVLMEAQRPVMLVQEPPAMTAPLAVIYKDSPLGRRALQMAAVLAASYPSLPLTVLVRDGNPGMVDELKSALTEQHSRLQDRLRVRRLSPMELYSLYQISYSERPGLLILAGDDTHASKTSMEEFLKYAEHPVVLVR